MFSTYFVFHCLNMFCVEKQVSEFFATHLQLAKIFATHLATHQLRNTSREFIQKLSRLSRHSLVTQENFRDSQKQLFKVFFVGNLF